MYLEKLAMVALVATLVAGSPVHGQTPIYVDGVRLPENALVDPSAGRAIVPMRALFETMGARVAWDVNERAAYAWTADRRGVRIPVGQANAQILEMSVVPRPGDWGTVIETRPLDVTASIRGGRTYIPLRFVSEALQAQVRYAAAERAIHVDTAQVAGFRDVAPATREVRLYFPRRGDPDAQLAPVSRRVDAAAPARGALEALLRGPTAEEAAAGLYSEIPPATRLEQIRLVEGIARARFNDELDRNVGGSLRVLTIRGQIERTLLQFDQVRQVVIEVNGRVDDVLQP
jgi:hypothetical protein